MNTNTEFDSIEEQVVENLEKSDAIELSLTDLDMVGGGTGMVLFG